MSKCPRCGRHVPLFWFDNPLKIRRHCVKCLAEIRQEVIKNSKHFGDENAVNRKKLTREYVVI